MSRKNESKSSGLQSNTKARSAAVHYKQLLAVGPEKLHTVGTEKKHGVTETYKALPRKDIFRTFNVVRRKTPQIQFGGAKPRQPKRRTLIFNGSACESINYSYPTLEPVFEIWKSKRRKVLTFGDAYSLRFLSILRFLQDHWGSEKGGMSAKSGKASVENCSLSATSTAQREKEGEKGAVE